MVSASGVIHTIAGTGNAGFLGDGGLATSASLSAPLGLTTDGSGNVYIADTGNSGIWMLTPASSLSISKSHSGIVAQGQKGVAYSITVSNSTAALATSGTVTVQEV